MEMGLFQTLNLPPELLERQKQYMAMSYEQRLQADCDSFNAVPGNLTGYDCPKCLNRGGSYAVLDGTIVFYECSCIKLRESLERIRKSGLSGLLDRYRFDTYEVSEPWQQKIKQSAMDYVEHHNGRWFFIGGQVGAGKTHICTAVVSALMAQGRSARYMLWQDEIKKLKAAANEPEYNNQMDALKTVEVLYIDDLFKPVRWYDVRTGSHRVSNPTEADIRITYELLNHRYMDKRLITLFSCELGVADILEIDQASGSRIYERTKGFCNQIANDERRNYRLRELRL